MSTQDNISNTYNYVPTNDEPFMSDIMLAYFRNKLLAWRSQLLANKSRAERNIQEEMVKEPDQLDLAMHETRLGNEFLPEANRDRELIDEIDSALERIIMGTYGYCEETAEPISTARLDAWPIARFSTEAQKDKEKHSRK
jgi:DnaK suppressor protein